jgi:hypothetical protein
MNEPKALEDMTDEELMATLPVNSIARQLFIATQAAKKITPYAERDAAPRKSIALVRPTQGRSTLQERSERRKIYNWILDAAEGGKPVALEALVAEFGKPVRGHVQKLLELGWLEVAQ